MEVEQQPRQLLYLNPSSPCMRNFPALEHAGWLPCPASSPEEARQLLRRRDFDIGVFHFDKGEDTLKQAGRYQDLLHRRNMEWIALLHRDNVQSPPVREMIADLFTDFHTLPVDLPRMLNTLGHTYGMAQLRSPSGDAATGGAGNEEEMVGCSPVMTQFFRSLRKVAATDATVLILGESGTGKELTARAIHERSPRAGGPMVAINCAAIPASLIQSELFGYEKGAFTGATQAKAGRIESADQGTLFLDEIGDLPMELQVHLLRFLQERQIDRIGGSRSISVDVRVIAATHVDLTRAVAEGRFREDLYHRLNVLALRTPSLRERDEDIGLLGQYYFNQFSGSRRGTLRGFSREAQEAMHRYDWPGNVRELINRVRRAVVMCEGRLIRPDDLGLGGELVEKTVLTLDAARQQAEEAAIRAALRRNAYNLTRSARDLDVSRVTLYRLLEKYAIAVRTPRGEEGSDLLPPDMLA
ncbi:sigma-54 dependent transcriptional regulator [Oryzomicrobium sp.]|uniref:sigma-54 dependent transcriptional regulator n=1 Tax=Oryzomicrobium sp. TaxID=1911578 RepID=UPI0025E331A9|nr:sigma-54 dependent transcriptional regulator [Oryzomicrobium sp.]